MTMLRVFSPTLPFPDIALETVVFDILRALATSSIVIFLFSVFDKFLLLILKRWSRSKHAGMLNYSIPPPTGLLRIILHHPNMPAQL